MARSRERGAVGVRLVQTAYHYRSLALYAKLGFVVREPLSVVQGAPLPRSCPGRGRAARAPGRRRGLRRALRARPRPRPQRRAARRDRRRHGDGRRARRVGSPATRPGFGYGWHAVAEANEDLHGPARAPRRRSWASAILVPVTQRRAPAVVPRPRPAHRAAVDADDRSASTTSRRAPGCPRSSTDQRGYRKPPPARRPNVPLTGLKKPRSPRGAPRRAAEGGSPYRTPLPLSRGMRASPAVPTRRPHRTTRERAVRARADDRNRAPVCARFRLRGRPGPLVCDRASGVDASVPSPRARSTVNSRSKPSAGLRPVPRRCAPSSSALR